MKQGMGSIKLAFEENEGRRMTAVQPQLAPGNFILAPEWTP